MADAIISLGDRKVRITIPPGMSPEEAVEAAVRDFRQNPALLSPTPAARAGIAQPERPPAGIPLPLPTAAQAEVAGQFLGGGIPGVPDPAGIVLSGLGAAGLRTARDIVAGEPSLRGTAGAFARGAAAEATGRGLIRIGRAGARALGLTERLTPEMKRLQGLFKKAEIPYTAADITGGRVAAGLERIPSVFILGAGRMQKVREAQLRGFTGKVLQEIDAIYQGEADLLLTGLTAREGLQNALQHFRRQTENVLEEIGRLAGDEPVRLARTGESLELLGLARPEGASAAARDIVTNRLVGRITRSNVLDVAQAAVEAEQVPFSVAFAIRKALGQRGFAGRARAIGTPEQGMAGHVWGSVTDDIDDFVAATANQELDEGLRGFKQSYAGGKKLFNSALISGIIRERIPPEQVATRVFRAGAFTDTLNFKNAVSREVFDETAEAWLDSIARGAIVKRGALPEITSPAQFVRKLKPYVDSGQIDIILPPQRAQIVRDLVTLGSSINVAERIAGNPSGTASNVLGAMQILNAARVTMAALFGAGGAALAGAPGAAVGVFGPPLIAQGVTRGPGIRLLSEGLSGRVARPATRAAAGLGIQQIAPQ